MPSHKKYFDVHTFGLVTEPRYYFYGWAKSPRIFARASALHALVNAKKVLPKGYNFKIWDCKRSYETQLLMIQSFHKRLKLLYPKLNKKQRDILCLKFSGGSMRKITRLDTHRNGGSFDLTIIDDHGHELFMGTDHDDLTERAATDFFKKKKVLTPLEREAKKNRHLLSAALSQAGFKNYVPEWWHWSFEK